MGLLSFLFPKKSEAAVTTKRVVAKKVVLYKVPPEPPLVQIPETEGMQPWEKRKLVEFNRALVSGRKRYISASTEGAFAAFPGAELRKFRDVVGGGIDWKKRWLEAGGRLYDGRMIARIDDPIWGKISEFGVPYEPFDRTREYGLEALKKSELQQLGIEVPMTKFQYDLKRSGMRISRDQIKIKAKVRVSVCD